MTEPQRWRDDSDDSDDVMTVMTMMTVMVMMLEGVRNEYNDDVTQ